MASSSVPTMPPQTPSQLLPGLIAGASLLPAEGAAAEIGEMSAVQTSTKIDRM